MHTRCCSPPESCDGMLVRPLFQPDPGQRIERLLLVGHAVEVLRQHHVLERSEVGNQMKLLEDEADFLRPHTV